MGVSTKHEGRSRIAILLPDLRGGGAERVNINLANEFVARGFLVDMVVMAATGEMAPLLHPHVRVIDLGVDRMRSVLFPLTRYLRQVRPSSLLACMWPLTVIAPIARIVSKVKTRLIVAEHTTWSADDWYRSALNRLVMSTTTRLAYPMAQGVVAVSDGAADDLSLIARFPRERVTAIYNPVTGGAKLTATSGASTSLAWTMDARPRILAVGSLKPIKGFGSLLRAFAIVRRRLPDAGLLILGEGHERRTLEALVGELELGSCVAMPGFVSDPDAYFREADLFVLSSTGEGFGNVIVEALEQGTPVVSTDCPSGPREILEDGHYGKLVPVANVEALAEAMLDTLAGVHDVTALKNRAADFSVTKAVDAYLDLLLPDWRQLQPVLEGGD